MSSLTDRQDTMSAVESLLIRLNDQAHTIAHVEAARSKAVRTMSTVDLFLDDALHALANDRLDVVHEFLARAQHALRQAR